MPKVYSIDLRKKVLEANENHEGSNDELAERFKISISTVKRIKQRYQITGSIEVYVKKCGRKSKLDEHAYLALKNIVSSSPDLTLKEIAHQLYQTTKITIKKSTVHNALKHLNFKYKKKSVYAIQRDSEDVKKKTRIS